MTPEEQIEHERHIAAILKIRKAPDQKDSTLSTWLNSNVLTAVIGVLGTAVLGEWVSGVIQERSKQNELTRSAREARQQSQREAIDRVLSLAGSFFSASDDLLTTAHEAYGEKRRPKAELPELAKWKTEILALRNKADSEWRGAKGGLGFELRDVFDGAVDKEWDRLVSTTTSFEKCTREWYVANSVKLTPLAAIDICSEERVAAKTADRKSTRLNSSH